MVFFSILDACVDKAKVEESEKKAAEFSRKVSPNCHSFYGMEQKPDGNTVGLFHSGILV